MCSCPADDGYDTARQTWNITTFDQRPAIVVMPAIATDVASAVGFAREHNLSIAAQAEDTAIRTPQTVRYSSPSRT